MKCQTIVGAEFSRIEAGKIRNPMRSVLTLPSYRELLFRIGKYPCMRRDLLDSYFKGVAPENDLATMLLNARP
jgi:hypothetical protein